MERRFVLFLALCFLVLTLNGMWSARQLAKRQEARKAAEPAAEAEKGDAAADENGGAEGAQPPPDADAESLAEDDEPASQEEEPETPTEFVTLGSVDPRSDYRMLVTLTNRGAAVRRVELSNPRYLDIHDRTGYLGHLELTVAPGQGLLVNAVGEGTPAAKAGVQVGDVLVEAGVNELKPMASPSDLANVLQETKPKTKLRLVLKRGEERREVSAVLARRPLDLIRPESENVLLRDEPLPPGFVEPPSFLWTLAELDGQKLAAEDDELAGVELAAGNWRIVDRDERSATFERRAAPGLIARKKYELEKAPESAKGDRDAPAYHVVLTLTLKNDAAGASARLRQVAYRLDGPNGLPIEGWWYATKVGREWGAVGLRDVVGRYFDAPPQQIGAPTIATGKAENFEGSNQMAYMGVDAQYFCAALVPQYKSDERWIASATPIMYGPPLPRGSTKTHYVNVTARMVSERATLAAGEEMTHRYVVFLGPKRPSLVAKYYPPDAPAYSLLGFVYYGWFGGVAQAMVGILHFFYAIFRNYGIAIIALTVLVRGCMFPISRKQARSMAKLQELRPEMEKIKEKYKGDQQKQAQAMQQLYRKYNVNPLAGCLPMLIQLPIFVGLWRGLAVDIELRQAPLFGQSIHWCSNLAAPDMFLDWSGFMPDLITKREGFFWLGPYLNLLPLVTIGLFLWQQKMFMPEPTNEQAAMQQKIMKWMMVVMSIFFYKVPSGLCLYLIASSLWGIAERKLVPPPTGGLGAPPAASPAPTTRGAAAAAKEKRPAKNGQVRDKRGAKQKRRR